MSPSPGQKQPAHNTDVLKMSIINSGSGDPETFCTKLNF